MTPVDDPITFLRKGRDFLAANHWGQGYYRMPNYLLSSPFTRYCVIGAMADGNGVGTYVAEDSRAVEHLSRQIVEGGAWVPPAGVCDPPRIVTEWNDVKGRTKEQVLDLIDRTIARLA